MVQRFFVESGTLTAVLILEKDVERTFVILEISCLLQQIVGGKLLNGFPVQVEQIVGKAGLLVMAALNKMQCLTKSGGVSVAVEL